MNWRWSQCGQHAFSLHSLSPPTIVILMKTMPLTVRRCPQPLHQALSKSAQENRRSLNAETLVWLEEQSRKRKPVTGREAARILREAQKLLSPREHKQLAEDIEAYRHKSRRERLR